MSVGANIRWTPAEAWLIAEVARRSLVASLDGAPPIAPGDHAAFRLAVHASAEAITLELVLDAQHAIVTLAPSEPAGHRWRDGWMLELERGDADEKWTLSTAAPSCEIVDARRAPVRAHLRLQRRAFHRELAGETIPIVVTDVASHRYTRQSTLAEVSVADPGPWMVPTRPERAPWWEVDLGKPQYLAWVRVDLAVPAVPCRVIVRAYGFVMPSGDAPPGGILFEGDTAQLAVFQGHAAVVAGGVVARYLRVELACDEPASLAITAVEVLAAELYADSLLATMRRAFALFRDQPLVLERAGATYAPALSYGEVWARALALGRGLAVRLEPRADRIFVAVMMKNRAEWIVAELAALVRGYVVVPVSPEDAEDRLAAIFARATPACVICEPDHAERARRLAGVPVIVCDDPGPDGFDAVCEVGRAAEVPEPAPRAPDDLYSVLFTSGSTGTPKGAMRSYAGLFAMIRDHVVGHSPRHLSFQPLSHMSERTYLPSLLVHGGTVAFSRGGAFLLEELRALEPTTIGSVPRLYEVLHAGYQRRLRALLAEAPGRPRGELEAIALAEARGAFGGQLFAISVGSAPVSAEVLAFLRRCFADIWVSEGYGSTEVGTIASDGRLPDGVLVKLVPLPGGPGEPGQPERGELYVRAPHLITGYLGDAEATAAAFDADGYFATGDLAERDADGRVRVIGRVRNTVKLAQGEFVSAERIETALAPAAIVDRILVHAEPGAPGVAALVLPAAEPLARALERDAPLDELVAHPEAAAVVLGALRARAKAVGLAPYETPRGVCLVAGPFTALAGELTASGKLARGTLVGTYGARLAALAAGEGRALDAAPDELAGDLRARVVAIAGRVLGHPVAADDVLASAGVDSLASAEILAAVSDELGRDVPLAWWFESRTFGELAERLARFAGGDGAQATRELAAADRAWVVPAPARPREVAAPRRVLVTGATGFLGAHLVEALRARAIDVVGLVRAPDDEAARTRLAAALADREIAARDVPAIAGDLADPDLAARLADLEVDAIVHAGATVSWLASYAALRAPNVGGTRALVELAAARGLALHHVSTISTAPADGDETSRLAFEAVAATTPYALSKWIAEDHVARARDAGLAAAIYRPAMIAGHTTRGVANPDDYLCRYLAGCVELGRYIDRDDAILDMTPVDFVASAIVALVLAQPGGGGTFHLANVPRSLSFAAVGRALRAAGYRVEPVTYPEFRAALHAAKPSRLHALAAFFPETFSLGMGPWPAPRTDALLAELGVPPPKIDDATLARYTAWLDRRGHLGRALLASAP